MTLTTIIKHLAANKYALGLHTTTPELGLAISNFADYPQSQVWNLGRDLTVDDSLKADGKFEGKILIFKIILFAFDS